MSLLGESLASDPLAAVLDELALRCTPIGLSSEEGRDGRLALPRGTVTLHVIVQGDWLIDTDLPLSTRWLERGEVIVASGHRELGLYPSAPGETSSTVLSMRVDLDAPDGHPLLDALPAFIRVTPGRGSPSLGLVMDALLDECLRRVPGRAEIIRHLCAVLFVHALRSHLDDICWNDVGWFRALADPLLREHLHRATGGGSSVSALARAAYRSTRRIRARFKQFGLRPSRMLREARARRAASLLREGETDLERIAAHAGYGSRQALARSFRRQLGVSPTEYWRQVHRRPFPRSTSVESPSAARSERDRTPSPPTAPPGELDLSPSPPPAPAGESTPRVVDSADPSEPE